MRVQERERKYYVGGLRSGKVKEVEKEGDYARNLDGKRGREERLAKCGEI